jgi:glycosyltransferase involved in cell wall biosynthesis
MVERHEDLGMNVRTEQPRRCLIVAARSWGEMGNILAARRLAAHLGAHIPDCSFDVHAIEDFYSPMEEIGARISRIKSRGGPAQVRAAYFELMDELTSVFPSGFELGDPRRLPAHEELRVLAEEIRSVALVIGTKGLISRLCISACSLLERHGIPVVNYVTNEGLLQFNVHLAKTPSLQIVPGQRGVDLLVAAGVPRESIRAVGYLLDAKAPGAFSHDAVGAPPSIGILINHGGEEYWPLIEAAAARGSSLRVSVICVSSDAIRDRILKVAPGHWRVMDRLAPREYMRELAMVAQSLHPLMICKAGPNTVLECLAAGVPVLALQSGLPQEDWVAQMLLTARGGLAGEEPERLAKTLNDWLDTPSKLAAMKTDGMAYIEALRRDTASAKGIVAAVEQFLSRRGLTCEKEFSTYPTYSSN